MRRPGLALLVGALVGCTPSTASKTEAARETVRRFFSELPSGDCAVLGPMLAGEGGSSCQEQVADLIAHGFSLVEVLDVKVDGRDADAVMVRARVARDGRVREQPMLLRVERHPEGWKLRL
ncbi:hypothetical protein F0U62_02775 [Cystobacter fuscus]|uniref:hypothetical protein n=1 Tax=Cystobacter fuscus TaxID=43 RepID=UPI002B27CCB0|nr:hypothetical protein F0U62_02775 [Cystobacter fuscus]